MKRAPRFAIRDRRWLWSFLFVLGVLLTTDYLFFASLDSAQRKVYAGSNSR